MATSLSAPGIVESKDNYGTPQMAVVNGKKELIVFGGDIATGQDPATGKELWRINLGGDMSSSAITFSANGKQMVTMAAGSAIFTFSLP